MTSSEKVGARRRKLNRQLREIEKASIDYLQSEFEEQSSYAKVFHPTKSQSLFTRQLELIFTRLVACLAEAGHANRFSAQALVLLSEVIAALDDVAGTQEEILRRIESLERKSNGSF